jgi:HPt (histidine-containing phosphotransfer) domain-containing protein
MAQAFVLDRKSILERLGGDEDIYSMMVEMYLGDVENNCTSLAAAFASGDSLTLQREAHTIKGLLATFSDEAGAADAMLVEKQARSGEIAGLADAVAGLQQRLREVAAVLAP